MLAATPILAASSRVPTVRLWHLINSCGGTQGSIHFSELEVEAFMGQVDADRSGTVSYPAMQIRLLELVDALLTTEVEALLDAISIPTWREKAKRYDLIPDVSARCLCRHVDDTLS